MWEDDKTLRKRFNFALGEAESVLQKEWVKRGGSRFTAPIFLTGALAGAARMYAGWALIILVIHVTEWVLGA